MGGQAAGLAVGDQERGEDAGARARQQRAEAWPASAWRAGACGAGSSRAPTAVSSGVALMRHSAYSAAGSESATMPPPAPSQALPAANSKVRIATFSSRPAAGERYPTAPV